MTEEWRPVEGFDGYEVSDEGRVRSYRTKGSHLGTLRDAPRLLNLQKNGNGYLFVWLSVQGKITKGLVHRLVADAFLDGPKSQEVAHWNGVRSDNRIENLRWVSVKENSSDRKRHGTHGSRLSQEVAEAVKRAYVPGIITQQEIAEKFGLSQVHVSRIVRGESWKHLV